MKKGTETISPRYRGLDVWKDDDILEAMWEGQARAIAAVRRALPSIGWAARSMAERLGVAGRIIYVGAGTSGRLAALDGAELAPTFGWPEARTVFLLAQGPVLSAAASSANEDDAPRGRSEMLALAPGPEDAVVAVAASGTTPYTRAAALAAAEQGALVIAIANNADAPLFQQADVPILLDTGAEIIGGSTRMNAGTAQKSALNLLSSLLIVRLGHVYDGLLVNLNVSNEKLRQRALAILMRMPGCAREAAAAALDACGGRVKPAVLVIKGSSASEAAKVLARSGGNLRTALADLGRDAKREGRVRPARSRVKQS
ncbi:MAG: N-acetylmuramic acid 6-phosphate etherase [Alphaproteobacteria bacterium]